MSGIRNLIENFAQEIQTLGVPLGILALVLLGASLLIGLSSPQEGKNRFFYICLGLAVISGAGSIVAFIMGS